MTIEEAINILSPNSESRLVRAVDGFSPTQKVLCALEMAIAALHSQKTPAKLDRSRWEGCILCEGVTGWTQDLDEEHHEVEFLFCPSCGRPINEEAWAELERKIGGNDGTADA